MSLLIISKKRTGNFSVKYVFVYLNADMTFTDFSQLVVRMLTVRNISGDTGFITALRTESCLSEYVRLNLI
jgi:hypothetical protein